MSTSQDDDVIECALCHGAVHPDAEACRHCGASFDEERFTPVQRMTLAWVGAVVAWFTGLALLVSANTDGGAVSGLGVALCALGIVLVPAAVYLTIRAATRS